VEELLRKLLSKIGYTEQTRLADMDANGLKEKIKEKIKGRKCLIVLDDVWDREAYTQISDTFCDLREARIVITTRSKHVASLAPPTHQLQLQPLGKGDAFKLFCREAFCSKPDNRCPPDLEQLADSIIDRCQGLPLAILCIAGMLCSVAPREDVWKQILNKLHSELSKNDNVQAILYLSYCDLPEHLRNCFLYCSLFPEDYPMPRKSLVCLWVAEGFAVAKDSSTPEEVAEWNLMELIGRNLLELVEYDELGRVRICKMHNIVRELALSIAKEEMFVSANDSGAILLINKEVRRLSTFGWEDKTESRAKFPRLRTFISLATVPSSTGMLSSILSESSYLTVLDLRDSEVTEVPASIGNLFNLRYISLRRTRIKSIPESIGQLYNLSTLDIKQTKIDKLPQGIAKVKKLRHLLVDRFSADKQTNFRYVVGMEAPNGLFNLQELQSLETVECSNNLAKQLNKLRRLESLCVDNISVADCADLFAALSYMPILSSLVLSAKDENEALCFEALKPVSRRLTKLIIRGQWVKGTLNCPVFLGHGKNLRYLALSWCCLGEDPLGMLAPHMPSLSYLRLNNMQSANTLVLSAGSFPRLKTLVLKHMPDVTEICIIDGALPSIEHLYIVSLSKLDKVPQGIESLCSLKKLWLLDLHKDFKSQWVNNGMHQKILHVPEVRL
jgi:disease resistance protein RPM1